MTSPTTVLKSIGPKLVPFFKTVAIYFVLFIPNTQPSVWSMIAKCAPILSLMFFVLLHGMSLGDEYSFSRNILFGLIFSCFGDAMLVWPEYFLHGVGCFAIAQIFYIRAFGFQKLRISFGIVLFLLASYVVKTLSKDLDGVLQVGLPLYSYLVALMTWRAIARVNFSKDWTWTEICSCVGGMFFLISDALIGFDKFHNPIPNAQVFIMTTYYIAQLGIALSVVDSSSVYKLAQEKLLLQKEVATKKAADFSVSSDKTAGKTT